LRGDMSLVGNRPLPLYEAEALTNDEWAERFMAPAGLTGLWQVTKRGQKDMSDEERIQLDIEYARQYSSIMDAKILVKTLTAFKQAENV
jgi:lipopolysaccharide/colanic/teichoic acid biosynthesis glycosyltransferase